MAKKSDSGGGDNRLPQHPLVSGLRANPDDAPTPVVELAGFPGDSPRAGYQRLYLKSTLDYYAEFSLDDLLHAVDVPADAAPFPGHEVVIVSIRRDAQVEYTWTATADDDFDLDVRLDSPMAREQETLGDGSWSMGLSCSICPSHNHCPSTTHCSHTHCSHGHCH